MAVKQKHKKRVKIRQERYTMKKQTKEYYKALFVKGYDQHNTVMEAHKLVNRAAIAMQKDGYSNPEIKEIANQARIICGLDELK